MDVGESESRPVMGADRNIKRDSARKRSRIPTGLSLQENLQNF
jgi:hypothetical protein